MDTEESTPLAEDENDTLNAETKDTSLCEPEVSDVKPETEAKAETEENPKEQEKLYFGKYKTIEEAEKGYKEAEKSISRAAELEKQLKAYQDKESQIKQARYNEARDLGYDTPEAQEIDFECKNYEYQLYRQALEYITNSAQQAEAVNALIRYSQTLNPNDLAKVRGMLNPDLVANIAENAALYRQKQFNDYRAVERKKHYETVQERTKAFAKETGDWLTPKERQDAVAMALNVTDGNADLNEVKKLIDAIESSAIERFKTSENIKLENNKLQDSLNISDVLLKSNNGKKWLTREEYYNLSESEEKKMTDLIDEQIRLEYEGKLPRELTK